MTENLASRRKPPIDQMEPATKATHLPREMEILVDEAIHRSIDQALHAAGLKLAPPQEQAIAERVSRDAAIAIHQTISASYYGPIPPPAMLGEFEQMVPGLAAKIVDMAVGEQKHPHRW